MGLVFLKLIKLHFPKTHAFHKIFNKNNLKLSYSCTKNVKSIIQSHNAKITNPNKQAPRLCNCRANTVCPLSGKCLSSSIVYQATVISDAATKTYIGQSGGQFKSRLYNHIKSFKHMRYANDTVLSQYVWKLKDNLKNYTITWEILKQSNTKKRKSGTCCLCLDEKLLIMDNLQNNLLNKRSEFISTCRHNKHTPIT